MRALPRTQIRIRIWILLCLGATGAAFAQATLPQTPSTQTTDEPAGRFDDVEEVRLVEVRLEVWDGDPAGNDARPIAGLEAGDLRLRVGGEEVPVARLEEIVLEPADGDQPTRDALPAAARRNVLFLFDLDTTTAADRADARRAARQVVLGDLGPGLRAAVARFDLAAGVRFLTPFTADGSLLAVALESLDDGSRESVGGPDGDPAYGAPSYGAANEEGLDAEIGRIGERRERTARSLDRRRGERWTASLGELADALARLPGRTHVVLVSGGRDASLFGGTDAAHGPAAERQRHLRERGQIQRLDPAERLGDPLLRRRLEETLERFRRAGGRVHVLDASARHDGDGDVPAVFAGREDGPLRRLARGTGGILLHRFGEGAAGRLGEILRRPRRLYLLSFYAPEGAGDEALPLEVTVRRPAGARVVHRSGVPPQGRLELPGPLEREVLAASPPRGGPPADLGVELLAVPFPPDPRGDGAGRSYVAVLLEIDAASLAAPAPRSGSPPGETSESLEIDVYVYAGARRGSGGVPEDFVARTVRVDPGRIDAGLQIYADLALPPGEHVLRALVRRRDDGRATALRRPLEIPAAGPLVLPPLVPRTAPRNVSRNVPRSDEAGGESWRRIRLEPPAAEDGTVVYPFVAGGRPFVPAAVPRIAGGERVVLFVYGLEGELHIASRIGHASAVLVDLEELEEGPGGLRVLRARLAAEGVSSGPARLRVAVASADGSTVSSASPVHVTD